LDFFNLLNNIRWLVEKIHIELNVVEISSLNTLAGKMIKFLFNDEPVITHDKKQNDFDLTE